MKDMQAVHDSQEEGKTSPVDWLKDKLAAHPPTPAVDPEVEERNRKLADLKAQHVEMVQQALALTKDSRDIPAKLKAWILRAGSEAPT